MIDIIFENPDPNLPSVRVKAILKCLERGDFEEAYCELVFDAKKAEEIARMLKLWK